MGLRLDRSCVPPISTGTMWSAVLASHPHLMQGGLSARRSLRFLVYSPLYLPVRCLVSLVRGVLWLEHLLPLFVIPLHPSTAQTLAAISVSLIRFGSEFV